MDRTRKTALSSGEKGLFGFYAFSRDLMAMVRFFQHEGPICMSSDWLVSMNSLDADFYARVDYSRGVRGRHLYASPELNGRDAVIGASSWSASYGYEGRVRISEAGMAKLLKRNVNNQAMTFIEGNKKRRCERLSRVSLRAEGVRWGRDQAGAGGA